MTAELKVIISIIFLSIAILGGIFVLSGRSSAALISATKVDKSQLVRPDSYFLGPENAKVTLVEFSDFQCPACKAAEPAVEKITSEYKDNVKFVYRHFPLPIHNNSQNAALAAEAAGEQGKFWEMHHKLFETQNQWAVQSNPGKTFEQYAADLGLDVEKYKTAVTSQKIKDKIALDMGDTEALNLNGTPTFYLDGQKLEFTNGVTYDLLKAKIEAELNK